MLVMPLRLVHNRNDPMEMLFELCSPEKHGRTRLKEALTYFVDEQMVTAVLIPLVSFLQTRKLNRGASRAFVGALIGDLYRTPLLPQSIATFTKAFPGREAGALTWFVLELLKAEEEARGNGHLHEAAQHLLQHPNEVGG